MKHSVALMLILLFSFLNFTSFGQSGAEEQLGLPGDNLNLYAVMKLFQESPTLEGFEKSLNDESLKINNLDLNGDDKIDYISVTDTVVNGVHDISLKVAVSETEDQDVAAFAVQKDAAGKVVIQLVGDEDLYGKDYIVEPGDSASGETPNPGYSGNTIDQPSASSAAVESKTVVEVNNWPVISYMFLPTYSYWYSPWHWGYYPGYWRPWKPFYWHYYYGYHYHWNYYYFSHYRRWPTYRIPGWYQIYYNPGYRRRSVIVQTRVRSGNYRQTYSRPQLAKQGSSAFRKDFPKAPSANVKLPAFDDKGRPVKKPLEPGGGITKPVVTRPVTKPVQPITRPVTRPLEPIKKPITRPVQPITKPVTRPVTKPVQPITRPVTKPVQPSTRPVIKQRLKENR